MALRVGRALYIRLISAMMLLYSAKNCNFLHYASRIGLGFDDIADALSVFDLFIFADSLRAQSW